ncbi:MAG TPA: Dna2/Cas4 domain-containing protein, partial [Saprospiraceae bacterium]|nr:Dna2/Cas4 domain-containing protein [Saprospiraceae bacterium]
AKIDFYDAHNRTVHETKKSAKMEQAHIAQVKFYLYVLLKNGIADAQAIIEYPKQRERTQVRLTLGEEATVEQWLMDIRRIVESEVCPPVIRKPVCKQCSYYEFCYSDEV